MSLSTLPSLNFPRGGIMYATIDSVGRPTVVGGTYLPGSTTPDPTNWNVEQYDPSAQVWSVLAQANNWSAWNYGDQSGDRILKAGNALGNVDGTLGYGLADSAAELWDGPSNSWLIEEPNELEGVLEIPFTTHSSKTGGASWTIGDALYITGGFIPNSLNPGDKYSTIRYSGGDGGNWSFKASALGFSGNSFQGFSSGATLSPQFQPFTQGVLVDSVGNVWLGPGCSDRPDRSFMFRYVPGDDTFTRMSDPPILTPAADIGFASACISPANVIYTIAPGHLTPTVQYLFSYDTATDIWTRLFDPPSPATVGVSLRYWRGKVYTLGSPIYVYDPIANTWAVTLDAPAATLFAHVTDGIGVYFIGGYSIVDGFPCTNVQYWIPAETIIAGVGFGGSAGKAGAGARSYAQIIGA